LTKIHPLASVDPRAELADDVEVGPFCLVEPGVTIGSRTRLESHATIKTGTTMGEDNVVCQGSVLGGDPQDRRYKGETSYLVIGDRNIFREYTTVHRATGEDLSTTVGDDNFLMAYSHLGHNCSVHNWVTLANNAAIAGHVTIEDLVTIGGMCGVHQFCRLGRASMVAGFSRITRDVPPFMIVGHEDQVHDINAVGLRRAGVTPAARLSLHKACKLLFKSQLGLTNAMEIVRREVPLTEEVALLLAFEERRFKGKNGRGDQR
jgi:UDP-N-acetylglucosamine acyltransferase